MVRDARELTASYHHTENKSLGGKRKKKINALFIVSYIQFLATEKLFLGQNTRQNAKIQNKAKSSQRLLCVCKSVCNFLSLMYEKESDQGCRGVGSS